MIRGSAMNGDRGGVGRASARAVDARWSLTARPAPRRNEWPAWPPRRGSAESRRARARNAARATDAARRIVGETNLRVLRETRGVIRRGDARARRLCRDGPHPRKKPARLCCGRFSPKETHNLNFLCQVRRSKFDWAMPPRTEDIVGGSTVETPRAETSAPSPFD